MTLDDVEKGILGAGAAVIAALIGLVRGGDIRRIEALEKSQEVLRVEELAAREKVYGEVHQLRRDTQEQHEEVVRLIMEIRK